MDICKKTIVNANDNLKKAGLPTEIRSKIEIKQGLAEDISVELGLFDCVCMGETLEHVFNENKAIKNVAKVLNPAGKFICTVPEGGRVSAIHLRVFSKGSLTSLLSDKFDICEMTSLAGWIFCVATKK